MQGLLTLTLKRADALSNIRWHLPRVRLPDTVAGGLLGAGLGAGVYGVRRWMTDKDKEQPSLLQHIGIGAGLGAVGGNVVGDRARRYLVNNTDPTGHKPRDMGSLAPKSLSQFFRTAIQDMPEPHANGAATTEQPAELSTALRHELFRRSLGLPVAEGSQAYFRPVGDRPYVPTETSGGVAGVSPTVEFNPARWAEIEASPMGQDSLAALQTTYKKPAREERLAAFKEVLGRHGYARGENGKYNVHDLWDFALTPQEHGLLSDYIRRRFTAPTSLDVPVANAADYDKQGWRSPVDVYWSKSRPPSQREHFRILAQRKLLNDVLLHRGGVALDQGFDMTGQMPQPVYRGPP